MSFINKGNSICCSCHNSTNGVCCCDCNGVFDKNGVILDNNSERNCNSVNAGCGCSGSGRHNKEDKKVVIITGVMGGIGRAVLEKFYKEGWLVVGIDYCQCDMSEYLYRYYRVDLSGGYCSSRECNESVEGCGSGSGSGNGSGSGSGSGSGDLGGGERGGYCLKRIFSGIIGELGRVDCIVHLAARQVNFSVVETPMYEWDRVMNVNVRSIYLLCQLAFGRLVESRGSVVVVSSVHAVQSSENISLYAISKCALSGVVRNLSIEWAKYGIRVNGVAPGAVLTSMLLAGLGRRGDNVEVALEKLAGKHPMKEVGQPGDIGEIIGFLADSEKSRFITGQTIVVDGGVSVVLSTES